MLAQSIRRLKGTRLYVNPRFSAGLKTLESDLKSLGITQNVRFISFSKFLKLYITHAPFSRLQAKVFRNLSYADLNSHEAANNEGVFTDNGTFAVDTGKFTGRSPKDKWIVKQPPSEANVGWGNVNQPITPAVFDELYKLSIDHYKKLDKVYFSRLPYA